MFSLKNMQVLNSCNKYKTLQVVNKNYMDKYGDMLPLVNKLKTYQRRMELLFLGIYKSKNTLSP